ncbi:small G protein signaling modulator 1-like isoform X2 [Salvelinus fontinalis]|uniref:small G protein signaling modulator 1-like isoform X2 n=1 Tax=Salvelinus fontinalis TaxID=8038 RepID=UPI002486462F|nr:small G protein signaling modulator 1-like isoform X2 [Salvelinus fontinalis]
MPTTTTTAAMAEAEMRQRLLCTVKKEVKQIMEEAVTRKFVHEDSSHIVSFCAAVEACVLHGLKRRAAGFLRSNKIAALFMKVGKSFTPAEELCRKAQELEQIIERKRNQSMPNQDSVRRLPRLSSISPQVVRNLWIRTALIEKVLDKIVLYLVENSSKFYEKEAILMDPVDGPILASLLVGPCALEYTKMKTADHFWTDPSADELVQRHRIHSGHCRQDSPTKRPALCIQKRHSSSSIDERPSPSPSARDYVESLHQNNRATLLFGKNNVLVQPRDDMEAIPGYLSLHQTADIMTLKWTPNQLMNGSVGDLDYEHSVYWDYAMTIRLEEIVYLHCHQQVDSGGTVVLVSQDGIQRPPLRFPRGGHLLQFLSCLENGLLPHGQLDPPLWSQRGKGKVFPKLRNKCSQGSSDSVPDKEEDEATDYVFRILFPNSQSEFVAPELMDQGANIWQPIPRKSSYSSCTQGSFSDGGPPNGCNHERAPLKLLCDQMKYQIISRAFYGWLAYCRQLSTVRTHLSALVNHTIVAPDVPCDAFTGLTAEVWQRFLQDCTAYNEQELLRLVYFGGVDPSLRKEVWPFLLGHYQFGMSESDRKEVDEQVRAYYEQTMSEWLGCEAIVRQREKEQHAAALAKCLSVSSSVDNPNPVQRRIHHDSSISNESSRSCSSDRQSLARLQSDSSSSTQVFESVEEVDQIETEPKSKEAKQVPKIPNGGALPNGTSSPDSGHPSSRNFSVTSGLSDRSLSTEDSTAPDTTPKNITSTPSQLAPAPQSPVKAHDEELEADSPKAQPPALQEEKDLQAKDPPEKEEKESATEVTQEIEGNETEVPDIEIDKNTVTVEPVETEMPEVEIDKKTEKSEVPEIEMDKITETRKDKAADLGALESQKIEAENTSGTEPAETEEVRINEKRDIELPKAEVDAVEERVESKTDEFKTIEAKVPETEVVKMLDGEPTMPADTKELQSLVPETLKTRESRETEDEGSEPESVDPEENETSQTNHREPKEEKALTSTMTAEAMEDKTSELEDERTSEAGETKSAETSEVKEAEGKTMEKTETEKEVEANETLKFEEVTETKVVQTVSHKDVSEENVEDITKSKEVGKREEEETKRPEREKNTSPEADTRVATTESEESPSAIEMAKISIAPLWDRMGPCDSSGVGAALSEGSVPHLELQLEEEEHCKTSPEGTESNLSEEPEMESIFPQFDSLTVGRELKNEDISPVSSIGTTYSQELLDMYTMNLHRIEKDVQRCDRNYWYFTPANLEKLRNIMCSYIWQHLEIGYVQGMCDLLAPLLVILDDEAMAFSCFTELMKRMNQNFPHGGGMDTQFANMRSLIQILDSELFELMHQNGDYTHFYFCYRWFLLDLKRELVYDDVFAVWETIWAAKYASSGHFVLFIALALVEVYRDIILENNMDFTDIIKFFNEMAEHHNSKQILTLARELVCKVQTLIENK